MRRIILGIILLSGLLISSAEAQTIKTSYRNVLVYAYSQANSVYEDDNIKLEIYDQRLWATNKTKKAIFIDLSQCFMVHNGSSFPLFEEKQDEKHTSKKGYSTSVDEFITIAPSTGNKQNATQICSMGSHIIGEYTTKSAPSGDLSEYDERLFNIISEMTNESLVADLKGNEYLGTVTRHLTEDESINNIGATIAYAFSKKSDDWTTVALSTWVCDVILAPCYAEKPQKLANFQKWGFAAKESKPVVIHIKADSPFEFESDKNPLVVCDWEGDFEKGTFTMLPTTIYAKKSQNEAYKEVIHFDGPNANWGKMRYVGSIESTKQVSY